MVAFIIFWIVLVVTLGLLQISILLYLLIWQFRERDNVENGGFEMGSL